jgi:hypothetical protein
VSTTPAKVISTYLSEGNDYSFTYSYSQSLTGVDVSFRLYVEGATSTVGVEVATSAGTSANTFQTVQMSTNALATGEYDFEVYKDWDGASQALIYPADNVNHKFFIQSRRGV